MTKKQFVKSQRSYMVEFLTKLKPKKWREASLCKGWSVEDVAAHIVVREGILGPIGIVIPSLHNLHDSRVKKLEAKGHKAIINKLKKYPWYMPAAVNVAEYYVHNEDMLRGGLKMSRPELNKEEQEILWQALKGLVKVQKHSLKDLGSVQLQNTKTGAVITIENDHSLKDTVISGSPAELLLFFYGRRESAKVSIKKIEL